MPALALLLGAALALRDARASDDPPPDDVGISPDQARIELRSARPVLFGRGLPYAHSLGELRMWLHRWDGGPQSTDWYRPAGNHPLAAGLPVLAALLDGIAADSAISSWRWT